MVDGHMASVGIDLSTDLLDPGQVFRVFMRQQQLLGRDDFPATIAVDGVELVGPLHGPGFNIKNKRSGQQFGRTQHTGVRLRPPQNSIHWAPVVGRFPRL
ncbi:hypothetical protein D9M72_531420 [compost metagenome]